MCIQATVVVVLHHMAAEDMAVAGEVAATGIHLDLADSLPGGRCHCRTRGDSPPSTLEKTDLARRNPTTWIRCPIKPP